MNPALSNQRHFSESIEQYRERLRNMNKLVSRYLRQGVPFYIPSADRDGKAIPYRKAT